MAFALPHHWVWDSWLADDGDVFHLFYLRAPTSLGDPDLRHRHATIGHATSLDLTHWTDHGEVLAAGAAGSFDETATWTGSVVRGDDGLWRMFYTGAVFLDAEGPANVERIGMATSADLYSWTKREGFALRADAAHYEVLGDSAWHEEAWRDPWVFKDAAGEGWHMLVTARAKGSTLTNGGVVGHAWSPDLVDWTVMAPLGPPSTRFPHLEVLQSVEVAGAHVLLFSGPRYGVGSVVDHVTGVWAVGASAPGIAPVDEARLLGPAPLYAGRIVHDRAGQPVLLAFLGSPDSGLGGITDPIPVSAAVRLS